MCCVTKARKGVLRVSLALFAKKLLHFTQKYRQCYYERDCGALLLGMALQVKGTVRCWGFLT